MSTSSAIVTRFAPSPTGRLHLGHAYSALFRRTCWRGRPTDDSCCASRISIRARCRPEFEIGYLRGSRLARPRPGKRRCAGSRIISPTTARRSIDSTATGLLYPCFCSRKEIAGRDRARGLAHRTDPMGRSIPAPAARCQPRARRAHRRGQALCAAPRRRRQRSRATGPLTWHDLDRGIDAGRARACWAMWCWAGAMRPPAIIWRSRWTTTCRA